MQWFALWSSKVLDTVAAVCTKQRCETSHPVPNGWTYFSYSSWIALIASEATYNFLRFYCTLLRQLMVLQRNRVFEWSTVIVPYIPARNLRSTTYRLKTYIFRAFSVCVLTLWNALPVELRARTSIITFKRDYYF